MFFENQRRHVRQITDAVDYRKANVGIVLSYEFNDWSLRETDADDEVVIPFGEGAHGRLDRGGIAGFNIAQDDWQWRLAATRAVGPFAGLRTLRPGPRGRIKRPVILTADIENNTYPNLRFVVGAIARSITGGAKNREQAYHNKRAAEYQLHSLITSLSSCGISFGGRSAIP